MSALITVNYRSLPREWTRVRRACSACFSSSFQLSTWFFTTFSVSGVKEKVHYLDSLQQLFTCIRPEQMDIPPFVLEYDARVREPGC